MPPSTGMTWPSRLEPAPNGVTGIRSRGCQLEHARDLLGRRRVDDEIRTVRRVEGHVLAVQIAVGRLAHQPGMEKAARGADGLPFPWGKEKDPSRANVRDNSGLAKHELMPVESFANGAIVSSAADGRQCVGICG